MAVFPITKEPRQVDYVDSPGDSSIETPVDQGKPKKRARFTEPVNSFTASYDITSAEKATLKTFFKTTTHSGVDSFEWDDPDTGDTLDVEFVGAPYYEANGAEWIAYCKFREV